MNKTKELQHLSLATTYEVDNTFDSDKFIKMNLRVCHDGINPNRSCFDVDNMEKAKDSIVNIPILANVIFDDDGNPQFGGHDVALEQSKTSEGEYKLIYKETPIGLIPENCNHKIEKFNDKNYVFVDCYIWKEYSNYAQDIIERDENIKLSMEILVDGYSYNAKDKIYNITDYRYQGITFLNKDFGTGMENALATTGQFSEDNSKEKFIIMMQELKETLNQYNINNFEEGGSALDEQIKSLLEQYNVTVEALSFDIKDMSIEDLESKLKELYTENAQESNETFEEDNTETQVEDKVEKFMKSFELSHSDVRYALYQLLSPVETEDNEWYFIDQVYDDRFEYENWEGTKIYRQEYKKDGDNVSFDGDRIELFQERLTKEEKEALDTMRSNYSILETEVIGLREYQASKYAEERTQAEEILFSQTDAQLQDNEEYQILKQNASQFSLEQLEKEVAFIIVKSGTNVKFSSHKGSKKQNQTVKLPFGSNHNDENDNKVYGDLFEKYLPKRD